MGIEDHIIPDALMGDVWPLCEPGVAPGDLGSARLEGPGAVEIRSFQTLTLVYTVGRFGLDDTGGIKVVQRFTNDGGVWQTRDPAAMNYVTARASNGVTLDLDVEANGHQRPWDRSLRVTVRRGSMRPGDTIAITFGDRTGGGPGLRMPTFCESAHEFRVLADVCATGHFSPLPERPALAVTPGPPAVWRAALPGLRRPGATFALGLRADDRWGNPSDRAGRRLHLAASGPVEGLPATVDFPDGVRALRVEGLRAVGEGVVRIAVAGADGTPLARSNPLVVRAGAFEGFWADMHGQSGETVGVNPIREYFAFGRDLAFLDAMGHQANDFQIKRAFWEEINATTAAFDAPGRFVALPGYEWSGNTPSGGDHNVFFRDEGRPIRRSSHALLTDRSDVGSDANTVAALFEALAEEDCVLYAHVGGRPADIARADGGALRTSVEAHSDWGTFEWIMADSFALGYRHGLVCNSDGHKGRPGMSHPGASSFGAFGGLTCFLADELSRDGLFDAMRRRRHYGTTGARLHLDVAARFARPAKVFHADPRLGAAPFDLARAAMMGDIVACADPRFEARVAVETQAPALSVDILVGMEVVERVRAYAAGDLGRRYRVCFHGAEYRGRGRQTTWRGTARFEGAAITRFETVNHWNHDRLLRHAAPDRVEFDILTTGNFVGFDVWLDGDAASLDIAAGHAAGRIDLGALGLEPVTLAAGGLDRKVTITRLPETLTRRALEASAVIDVKPEGDTPVWARIATEDGHLAWSSPIYVFADAAR